MLMSSLLFETMIFGKIIETLDIETLIKSEEYNKFKFNPYDTITIKPTYKYYLLNNASAINMVLQIITLVLTVQDN